MKQCIATLVSTSPYSQSKFYQTPKLAKELPQDYEERTWRDRMHVNSDGYVFIPPMALKNCLQEAAKFLSRQIPGKGKATYTKHFEAGVLVTDPIVLPFKKDEVDGEWFFVPADGKRGSGRRVMKCFPVIPDWTGEATFHILDDVLTEDAFIEHLREAGNFIGLGRSRPRNAGYYGRFKVASYKWIDAV